MQLDKLFGSKAKVDILKYLIFKRQGVSVRALDTDLDWTFPAIRKQIDALSKAHVITIDKQDVKRSIRLDPNFATPIKRIFLQALMEEVKEMFAEHEDIIDRFYRGKTFGVDIDMDLLVIYSPTDEDRIKKIRVRIAQIFADYFIHLIGLTFMSQGEWEKRYRLADKFVLTILRNVEKAKVQ